MNLKSFALTFLTVCIATVSLSKAAQAASFTLLADGLDNPRGIGFDKDGNLYVANSGSGGDGKDGRCEQSPSSQFVPLCASDNGSVVKIAIDGTKTTVLSGLTSLGLVRNDAPPGSNLDTQGAGPADIKFDDKGNAYLLTGFAGDPNLRESLLKAPDLGKLYKVDLNTGSLTPLADIAQYEAKNNPDGTDLISNPYSFAIKGDNAYVVDGGGNTIYKVGLDGRGIQKVAALPEQLIPVDQLKFPSAPTTTADPGAPESTSGVPPLSGGPSGPLPAGYTIAPNGNPTSNQSVPTNITVAPDGSLTVTEYTAYPFAEGKARIWKVDDNLTTTGEAFGKPVTGTEIATGFTQLTGDAYDKDGNLYVLQHINQSEWKAIGMGGDVIGDYSGSLIKIAPDGTRTTLLSGDGLAAASGITVGPDGNLYISNNSRFSQGQVIKVDPRTGTKVPEPSAGLGLLAVGALGASAAVRKRIRQEKVGTELLAKVETF